VRSLCTRREEMPLSESEIVHDVAYDHYGRRVVTCCSDNTIKVFDEAGHKVAEWKAHSGSIWRLSWAHPEFGVVLASCSFDRKIRIWEETTDAEEVANDASLNGRGAWSKVAEITDARDSVVDVQFAPHHTGVRIASCGADGFVRIHQAPDVLDLSNWERHSEIDASAAAAEVRSRLHSLDSARSKSMHLCVPS
jgi:nucleoporin SEH1